MLKSGFRTRTFSYLYATPQLAVLLGPFIASSMMSIGVLVPVWMSALVYIISGFIVFLLPDMRELSQRPSNGSDAYDERTEQDPLIPRSSEEPPSMPKQPYFIDVCSWCNQAGHTKGRSDCTRAVNDQQKQQTLSSGIACDKSRYIKDRHLSPIYVNQIRMDIRQGECSFHYRSLKSDSRFRLVASSPSKRL